MSLGTVAKSFGLPGLRIGFVAGDRTFMQAYLELRNVAAPQVAMPAQRVRERGLTIVPTEIEMVLLTHPSVRDVAVVGVDDERLGERACAALILQPGAAAPALEELQRFLDEAGVGKYAWPERVEVFDEFPRTPSLKAVKRDIRAQIAARIAATSQAQVAVAPSQ